MSAAPARACRALRHITIVESPSLGYARASPLPCRRRDGRLLRVTAAVPVGRDRGTGSAGAAVQADGDGGGPPVTSTGGVMAGRRVFSVAALLAHE